MNTDMAVVVYCVLLGLAVGSFLNVVIWRIPRKESVVRPASRCPGCQSAIAPRDNIPLVSWALLRGHCRNCATAIPVRYPLVEATCAGLFGVVAARFGWSWDLPAFLVLAAALLAITVIDLEHYLIPNRIVVPVTAAGVLLLGMAAVGDSDPGAFVRTLGCGTVAFTGMLTIALISPKGMGMGDVKLSFVLGMYLGWLGWGELAVGLFLSFLLGAVIGVALIATRLRSRKDAVPFGPFLAAGTFVTILVGEPILRWYTGA